MSSKKSTSFRPLCGLVVVVLVSGLLSGCFGLGGPSDPVKFYTLNEPSSISSNATPVEEGVLVGLDAVVMPAYLEGKEIAVRLGENELRYSSSNRWAERPEHAVTRLLKHAIAAQSEVISDVVSVPWPDQAEPVRSVRVEILTMEGQERPVETVKLRLQWEIYGADGLSVLKRGEYSLAASDWMSQDYAGLMEAFSVGLEIAAKEMALDIEASLNKE